MFAIVDFKGEQFRVEKDQTVKIAYQKDFEIGSEFEIDRVLVLDDGKEKIIGQPVVKNAKVIVEVLAHEKDKKIIVFKKKRRKGYQKKQGHRQNYTEIKIKEIIN